MRGLAGWIALGAALLSATSLAAADDYRVGAVELERSDRYLLPSEHVGDRFRIDVVLPIGYGSSDERYPVVYVTDSNYLLYSALSTYLAQATGEYPKVILVGIGWDVPSITRIRVRDLTPTCNREYRSSRSMTKAECGQADAFVQFIGNELQPFIDERYRTAGDDTLVGYSYGGLFALHVLFNHTDLFNRYVIGSASMNWDDEYVFRMEQRYAKKHDDLAKRVYLSAGGLESDGTIPNTYRMFEQLRSRQYPGLHVDMQVFENETHMTNINPTVMRGLAYVLPMGPG